MAADAADIAAGFPVGTRLRVNFDHTADDWTFSQQQGRRAEIYWDTTDAIVDPQRDSTRLPLLVWRCPM
jgi:hypothetical protein